MEMLRTLFAAALAFAATSVTPTLAAYPERPVRLIVPYPAGGAADLPARILSEGLQRKLGKPFVVENKSGAAGAIGTEAAVRATPDGYTIYCGPNAPLVLLPQVRPLSYKPTDLVPIAPYGEVVYAFGVLSTMKANNLKELQALAKANPGKLSVSSPGVGSATHLRDEAFKSLAEVDIIHVPYRTGAEALPDLLAGRLDIMLDNIFFPQVRLGTVKMLGVLSERRHPEFPDVPTFAEQGFDIRLPVWGGFHAPVGTPREVIETLSRAVSELNKEPEVIERQMKIGWIPINATPEELHKRMADEVASYGYWVKKTDFKLD
jgi:tripartite-type tricarboxylate transporter receptor subunit TctC